MDNKEFINQFKAMLEKATDTAKGARENDERRRVMSTLGQDIAQMLTPFLKNLADSSKMNKADMREAMQELAANTSAREMPGVDTGAIIEAIYTAFGNLNMPQPRVNVTTPAVNVPPIRWPDGEMSIKGWVSLMGVSLENPLPVQLRDAKGRPVNLDVGAIPMMGGGASGGKGDFFTIKGFSQSAFAELQNPDGRVKVELPSGTSGLTDTELRAAHLDVQQVSGAIDSVNVVTTIGLTDTQLRASTLDVKQVSGSIDSVYVTGIFGTTITSGIINGDNRIRVSVETGGSGLTDAEIRATALPTIQVSGAIDSVNVVSTVGLTDTLLRASSVPVEQVSGSIWSTAVIGTPTVTVSGSITSTVVTGPTVADAVDDGTAPVQVGGIARTANPTAVAGNDVAKISTDDLGRTLTRPIQVRDLIQTAYATFATGTEATLIAGVASTFLDLIYIMGANNSDAAVSVDIRSGTANGVVMTLQIPASGTAGVALPVPLPQEVVASAWTADLPDITGTTVTLSALFSREI